MGIRVNPDRWLPMRHYLRLVWHFLTTDQPPSPYDRFYKSKWDRRWSRVKTLDGPVHTVWVHSTGLRYNWFTIGWACWRKGHDWGNQHVVTAPQRKWEAVEPGRIKAVYTGKKERYHARTCRRCGKFMGIGHEEV